MDVSDLPNRPGQMPMQQVPPGHVIGLQGRLARPFWGLMGIWAVLCGALASPHVSWDGRALLILGLALLLADLGWGSLWDQVVGTDWHRILAKRGSSASSAWAPVLPYTRPDSPGGRLFRSFNRVACWWREVLWPSTGPAILGSLAAIALVAVVSLLLPDRVRPLNAGLVVLLGLGMLQRWMGQAPLVGQAFGLVGLSWLAGHAAFSELGWSSVILALCFSAACWGVMRVSEDRPGVLWLLNGGQIVGIALLVALEQPLAAGAMGLLGLAQVALQPSLRSGAEAARVMQRTWPWLMAAMLVAALAVP
jgi:hypothetical protein